MPSMKRKTSHVEDSGFDIYAGDDPKPGVYRGVIKQCKIKKASTGNQYYNILVELEGNEGNKAVFNGFPSWVMLTMTDKEANLRREKNFYRAVCGKMDPDVVFDDLDKGGKVTKIGGKDPLKTKCLINIKNEEYQSVMRSKGDEIYPAAADEGKEKQDDVEADVDADLSEDENEDEGIEVVEADEEGDEIDERRTELLSMSPVKLRKIGKELDLTVTGLAKPALVDAILEEEFQDEETVVEEDDDDEDAVEEGPSYADLEALTLVKLKKAILAEFEDSYDAEDLAGLKKPELLEMLIEDELVEAPEGF